MTATNIVLYDGVCHLCNTWVNIVLALDKKKTFKFCSLQSPKGGEFMRKVGREAGDLSSIVLIKSLKDKEAYRKSDAILAIAQELGFGMYILSLVGYIVPRFLRDNIYDSVAANRYKWFGMTEQCRLPDPSVTDRFLDDKQ
jgi:predicted DCC family thiol-disulfide oxidoreductase YuxK